MQIPIEKASFVVCDVETTGLSPRNESIIEIGLIKIENLKITDKYSTLINPNRFIPPFITQMTGIRNEDVQTAPKFREISYKIQEFIGNSVFVAHNATFDYNFLLHSFLRDEEIPIRLNTICTKRLARRLFPGISSASLKSIARLFGFRNTSKHRALGDAKVTAQIFLKLLEEGKSKNKFDTLDELIRFQFRPIAQTKLLSMRKSLADSVTKLSSNPGIYFFRNKKGHVIYIGKAKNLKSRVLSYFRESSTDHRVKKILRHAHHLDYTETASELSAFLLESELIKKHKPRFNTALKIMRNYSFIGLTADSEYPRLEVTKKLSSNGTLYFGPFNSRETAEEILDILTKSTQLRECDDKTLDKKRPCYLLDIKRCLGPCVEQNLQGKYNEEIQVVKNFLTGNSNVLLNRLLEKMKDLSVRQKFEDAGKIRDTVQTIVNNIGKIKSLREPINSINALIFIYHNSSISEVIALKNGIVFFIKAVQENDEFLYSICEEYFSRTEDTFDLPLNIEKIKIISNFLVNKKAKYEIIYTTDINSADELFIQLKGLLSLS